MHWFYGCVCVLVFLSIFSLLFFLYFNFNSSLECERYANPTDLSYLHRHDYVYVRRNIYAERLLLLLRANQNGANQRFSTRPWFDHVVWFWLVCATHHCHTTHVQFSSVQFNEISGELIVCPKKRATFAARGIFVLRVPLIRIIIISTH